MKSVLISFLLLSCAWSLTSAQNKPLHFYGYQRYNESLSETQVDSIAESLRWLLKYSTIDNAACLLLPSTTPKIGNLYTFERYLTDSTGRISVESRKVIQCSVIEVKEDFLGKKRVLSFQEQDDSHIDTIHYSTELFGGFSVYRPFYWYGDRFLNAWVPFALTCSDRSVSSFIKDSVLFNDSAIDLKIAGWYGYTVTYEKTWVGSRCLISRNSKFTLRDYRSIAHRAIQDDILEFKFDFCPSIGFFTRREKLARDGKGGYVEKLISYALK
jgi:hypothetical protein